MKIRTVRYLPLAILAVAMFAAVLISPAQLGAAEAPLVLTLGTTNVTPTTAALNGMVNPKGAATAAWFEWGTGQAFNFASTRTNIGSGTSGLNVGAQVSGLTSGAIYHYRVAASNALGNTRGLATSFGVPKVTLLGASPQTNALNTNFVDPGAVVTSAPLAISTGYRHNLALKADGQVVGWGLDDNGQSSITNGSTRMVIIAAGDLHSLALSANGSVFGWGYTNDGAINIPASATNNVIAIAAGGYHSLALKSNGTVLAWGGDWDGQSTVTSDVTNVIALAAGNSHNLALRADGTVVGWGANWDGEIDTPTNATNVIAIAAGGDHSLALKADGTLVAWGSDSDGQSTIPDGATNVIAIAAGYRHSLALKANGSIVGWGANGDGQIDAPSAATNSIALAAGVNHSLSMKADGTLVYWGIADSILTNTPSGLNSLTNLTIGVTGAVNTNVAGTYVLTYRATNVLGFVGTASRTVVVADPSPVINTRTLLGNGSFQLGFDFSPNATFTVLATTNLALPSASWTVLGQAVESPAGHYQYTDSGATNYGQRYYRVRTP